MTTIFFKKETPNSIKKCRLLGPIFYKDDLEVHQDFGIV